VKTRTSPAHCARLARFDGWDTEHAIYRGKQAVRQLFFPFYRSYVRWSTKPFEMET
jgi:hypothetical protein